MSEGERKLELSAESERKFSDAVISSAPGILYVYDESGRFLRWNQHFETVSGYSGDEIERMHPLDFFAPQERALLQARIAQVFADGASSVEAGFVSKDGRSRPYLFTGRRVQLNGVSCLVGMGIDLSARSQAMAEQVVSEERYRTLFECAPDGILITDAHSYYLDANPSICSMLGYAREELIGLHGRDIVVPEETQHIEPALQEIRAQGHYEREWNFRRRDGSVFPVEVFATPMPDGNLLAMIRDVTARKAVEAALHELNETLEQKVVVRTTELEQALLRAEDADRLKSAFLASMSHELRTPLNSILGFTGIILAGMAGPLTVEQSKQLGMVRVSARHLLELINDILDLSKIEADQLEVRKQDFRLEDALEHVLELVRPLADKKGLTLSSQIAADLGTIHSDRRRVEQILLNLLNNAVKFTELGAITLCADIVRSDAGCGGSTARVRIIDTGSGIRPEHLGHLFQAFRQIDIGLARQHEGTGLGLAICKRLADLLGGEIEVSSEWLRGSVFTLRLPFPGEAR